MKPLEFPFRSNEFTHELVEREGLICLVKRSKPERWHWHYEVVRLRIRPAGEFRGKFYPPRESYPGNEDWGRYGFTYRNDELEKAKRKFSELSKAANEILDVLTCHA